MPTNGRIRLVPDPSHTYWNNEPILHGLHELQRKNYEAYARMTGPVYDSKTVLMDELSAWRYWITLKLIDLESDSWDIWVQIEHDTDLNWGKMTRALAERKGRQYHFNHQLSRPSRLWILQEIDQETGSILEMWSISDCIVVKCSTIFDLLQTRLNSVAENLSSTFTLLSDAAPKRTPQVNPVWQSALIQLPDQEASGSGSGSGKGESVVKKGQAGGEAGEGADVGGLVQEELNGGDLGKKKKGKTERQAALDSALAEALKSMTESLPQIENPSFPQHPGDPLPSAQTPAQPQSLSRSTTDRPKTKEELELEKLLKMVSADASGVAAGMSGMSRVGAGMGGVGVGGARGEKRAREEGGVGAGRQARFAV